MSPTHPADTLGDSPDSSREDLAIDRRLEAIALAVANGDPRLVPVQVQRAYASGASVSQVLTAVEVGRCLAELPSTAMTLAWNAAHAWAWIARRHDGPFPPADPSPSPAGR